MSKKFVEIESEQRVYDGYLKIDRAIIKDVDKNGVEKRYSREKVIRPEAVTGFVYNTETESVVLIRQYRYPTHTGRRSGFIFETVAGVIDEGESPIDAFIRESKEELGYKIKKENIIHSFSCYTTPGYSSEKTHFFLATVTNKDKIKNGGGGLKSENENIEVHEYHYLQFRSMMKDNAFEDVKIRLLAYEAHYTRLFEL